MNDDLKGKVAIVTGAGRMRSIGRKIATTLANAGAAVVVTGTGRSLANLPEDEKAAGWRDIDSVAEEIEQAGGKAMPVIMDISSEKSVAELFQETLQEFGRVDIVVNNAAFGLGADRVPVVDLDFDVFKKVFDVNTNGTFLMSREAARAMLKQGGGGNIINISSGATRIASPNLAAYTTSKLAVNGLGRTMAMELAKDKIRVNTICPGFNDTARMSGVERGDEFDKLVDKNVPLGWADDGTQVAELTLFLASDRGKWITGQTMMADGGRVWGH